MGDVTVDMPLFEIEHLMIGVPGHTKAIDDFERLGFTVRGVRKLPPMGGTAKGGAGGTACVMFRSRKPGVANYLELAWLDEPFAPEIMKPILADRIGGAMIVNVVDDIDEILARWSSRGLAFAGPETFVLAQVGDIGDKITRPSVSVLIPKGHDHPIYVNACAYTDNDEFSDPALTDHPNGIEYVEGYSIGVPHEELPDVLEHLAVIFGSEPERHHEAHRFSTSTMFLDLTPQDGSEKVWTAHLVTNDLQRLRGILRNEGMGHHAVGSGPVSLPSSTCCGIRLSVREARKTA